MADDPGGDLVLALDQGTSATKAVLVDAEGRIVGSASVAVGIDYPRPGWVEQDPVEVVDSVLAAAAGCLTGVDARRVVAVGLSTQRESALVWDRVTGRPVGPLLGWQDRRSAPVGAALRTAGHGPEIWSLSGLPVDPMFSASKLRWLLDRAAAGGLAPGRLAFGTVDSWLLHRLTGEHRIEIGNASRTQLLDVRTGAWSPRLLELFDIPAEVLPRVAPSATEPVEVTVAGPLHGLPVTAVLGDSHAALFAHGDRATAGGVKVTYGTGSSVMRLVATTAAVDPSICTTIGWGDPEPRIAAEGNIRSSGATVAWVARLFGTTPEVVAQRASTADNGGVHLVPAFTGLGAPWWDDEAVGLAAGLTLGTGPDQLARAAVESIAHQVADVVAAMAGDGRAVTAVLADGGASRNDVVMQAQADLTGVPVLRAAAADLSALGAARLAAIAAKAWAPDRQLPLHHDEFVPRAEATEVAAQRDAWRAAVARARSAPRTGP